MNWFFQRKAATAEPAPVPWSREAAEAEALERVHKSEAEIAACCWKSCFR